jgi:hypothetical protein
VEKYPTGNVNSLMVPSFCFVANGSNNSEDVKQTASNMYDNPSLPLSTHFNCTNTGDANIEKTASVFFAMKTV